MLKKHQDIIQIEGDTNFLPIIKNHPLFIATLQHCLFTERNHLANGQCTGVWDITTESIYSKLYNKDKFTASDCEELFYESYPKDKSISNNNYSIIDWYDVEDQPLYILHIDTNVNNIRNMRNPNNLYKILLNTINKVSHTLTESNISNVILNNTNINFNETEQSLQERLTDLTSKVKTKDKYKKCVLISLTYTPSVNSQWIPYNSLEISYSGNNTYFRQCVPILDKLKETISSDTMKDFTNTSIINFKSKDLPFHKISKFPSFSINLGCPNNIEYCKLIYDNSDIIDNEYTKYVVNVIKAINEQLITD